MIENLNFILKVIESDIFLSYCYYTIIFLIISLFFRNKKKNKVDDIFTDFIIHSGVFFIGINILKSFLLFTISDLPNREEEINQMFGEYWFRYWFIPLIHFLLTQLLRFNKVKKYIIPRLILIFILAFTWERYSGFLAYHSMQFYPKHRSEVLEKFTTFFILKHISLRIILYGILAYIYFEICEQIKKYYKPLKNDTSNELV